MCDGGRIELDIEPLDIVPAQVGEALWRSETRKTLPWLRQGPWPSHPAGLPKGDANGAPCAVEVAVELRPGNPGPRSVTGPHLFG